ncbi:tetratricopeptide repeat protein [Cyanobium sp. CH-040]|uniref:tetratricopeptide repeat protein n=1 Tax=Cyanobium sp. CH-040 TaxID=2823708 RepID=UPI0020CD51AA|nr:tetratricopeptide repeat protein [Cyanobium sp. CH-040]MCP9927811.1 tetratricopeptide repeat protein [Cyanobium sp. CH-040]
MPRLPNRSSAPQGLWLGLAAGALAVLCLGTGWWLGQRQLAGGQAGARTALVKQAGELRRRVEDGAASAEEQQRLLELMVALDQQQEATALLERLADEDPQRWSLRLLLAELRRDQDDRSGAERELRQILRQRPDQVEALQLMALLQLEGGRGAEARSQLEAALQRAIAPKLRPEALPIGLLLANVLERLGEPGQAEAQLIRLTTLFPADPRPLLARALLQHGQGNVAAAQATLSEARRRQSDPEQQQQLDRLAAAWGLASLREPASGQTQQPTPEPQADQPAGSPPRSP